MSFALGIVIGVALCFAAAFVSPTRPTVREPATNNSSPFAAAEARVVRGLANPKSVRFADEMHGLKVPRSVCGTYRATAGSGKPTRPVSFIVVEDALYLRIEGNPEGFDRIAALVGC
ncbi:MAG: hypothetical protein ACTHJR_10625 [Sphingomonas sp.]|uniref:hypothetical protein n=1 Tax=Sphingomonas sp. TaxID=28214 RepID=UPI003F813959